MSSNTIDAATAVYWEKQIAKHLKTAATLSAKAKRTGETRWQKSADSNAAKAASIRRNIGEPVRMPTDTQFLAALGPCGK